MPHHSDIDRRNRAIIAFTILTGCRDGAIASLKLKHVDLISRSVYQDAREVNTKFRKTFTSYFFPVSDEARTIVENWVSFLRREKLWGNDDPLFPATEIQMNDDRQFAVTGLKREHWRTTTTIRRVFRDAFLAAGLPYFHPHTFRRTLTRVGETMCQTTEDFKVWSQNLGHDGVLTILSNYGTVAQQRQAEILRGLASRTPIGTASAQQIAREVARELATIRAADKTEP